MNSSILISVIVPIYNVEGYLVKCIESILCQTYTYLQIILVDDGSDDNSGKICDFFSRNNSAITVIHKKNGGLRSARCEGLKYAKGEYSIFIDPDDWIDMDCFENLIMANEKYDADVIAYSFIEEYPGRSIVHNSAINDGFYDKNWICKNSSLWFITDNYLTWGIHPSLSLKLTKTKLLLDNIDNIPLDITYGEDAAFFYKFLRKADSLLIVNKPLYHYVQRNNSIVHELKELPMCNFIGLYNTLKDSFYGDVILQEKLKEYMFFTLLLKKYSSIMNYNGYCIFPFKKVKKGMKVFLYGAGGFGKVMHDTIMKNNELELAGWTDEKYQEYNLNGMNLNPISSIYELEYDVLVIAIINEEICVNIANRIKQNGISINKIDFVRKSIIDVSRLPDWLEYRR